MNNSYDVIVVGAGFAGATVTRDLRERGFSVLTLEAQQRLGGRAYSRPIRGREEIAEFGGTWVVRNYHPNVAREIERYGIPMHFGVAPEEAVFVTAGERRTNSFIPPAEFVEFERACVRLIDAARRINPLLPIYDQPVGDLDQSLAAFIEPLNLPKATRDLLYAYFSLHCSGHPDSASMMMILAWTSGFGASVSNQVMSLSEVFDHGSGHLVKVMFDAAEPDLRLGTPATKIVHDSEQVTVAAGEQQFTAAACVVAVPTNVLAKIDFTPELSSEKRTAIQVPHVGRGYKVNMVVKTPKPMFCLGWGGALSAIFTLADLGGGEYLMTGFGGESMMPLNTASLADVQRAIEFFAPQAEVVASDAHDWITDPYFEGTWRTDPPGRAHLFARGLNEPEGRLFFAGSDMTHTVWQNWFEGAVASGHRAADRAANVVEAR